MSARIITDSTTNRERDFHDDQSASVRPENVCVRESFEACTSPEARWILKQLGDLRGKRVLDLGCGAGESAVYFALMGADVTATDISPGMLEVVQRVAELHNVILTTQVCSADDLTAFADRSFDVVYAANLLHHVDRVRCQSEAFRVLCPGGTFASWDPLIYNPVINVYRRMATDVRTIDERPLNADDVSKIRRQFETVRVRCFWLLTLVVFLKFYFVDRVHPNEDRYWKRILVEAPRLAWWYVPLAAIDRALMTVCPVLGWWAWNVAIVARKSS